MTKKLTKAVLGLAVTAAIGAGVIGANGFFVANSLAANNNRKAPVVTADTVPVKADIKPEAEMGSAAGYAATVLADGNGKQSIVLNESLSAEDQARLEKDLEETNKLKKAVNVKPTFVAGVPSENDLPETAAIKTAKDAIVKEYALTDETLSKFSTNAVLNVVDPKSPIWSITFYPTNQNDFSQIGTYNITIDSLSGKIIKILSAADGVG